MLTLKQRLCRIGALLYVAVGPWLLFVLVPAAMDRPAGPAGAVFGITWVLAMVYLLCLLDPTED